MAALYRRSGNGSISKFMIARPTISRHASSRSRGGKSSVEKRNVAVSRPAGAGVEGLAQFVSVILKLVRAQRPD
jgi:hypothetical protein